MHVAALTPPIPPHCLHSLPSSHLKPFSLLRLQFETLPHPLLEVFQLQASCPSLSTTYLSQPPLFNSISRRNMPPSILYAGFNYTHLPDYTSRVTNFLADRSIFAVMGDWAHDFGALLSQPRMTTPMPTPHQPKATSTC